MVRSTVSRLAFTMIELIFAIVIIAISVLSLPVMVQITSKGIENNLLQEAIFAASAELMDASSGYWDERSMEDENLSNLSRVIDIGGGCSADNRLRPGHIAQPYHRRCTDSNSAAGLNGTTDPIFSLDDAEHTVTDMFDNPIGEAAGYKQTYQSTLVVAPDGANANIKHIISDVKDSTGVTTLTVLKMQSANVGEIEYYKMRF